MHWLFKTLPSQASKEKKPMLLTSKSTHFHALRKSLFVKKNELIKVNAFKLIFIQGKCFFNPVTCALFTRKKHRFFFFPFLTGNE
jgi:hypothetical protein